MSRLYRALVETGLAVGIAGDFSASIDPGLYSITLVLNSGVAPEEAVAAVDREIERIHRGEISAEEVGCFKEIPNFVVGVDFVPTPPLYNVIKYFIS